MPYPIRPLALACSLLSIPGVRAEPPLPLEPIVISAGRTEAFSIDTPASITVVGRTEIERSGARDLAELLRGQGGLHLSDLYGDGSQAVIDMRGFGATAGSNTLVLVDGRPLNNASDLASPDLASIDLAGVERVELVQGSAGTLFGNQAVGGVVNVITRRPLGPEAEVEAGGGSYGGYQLRARGGDRLDNGLAWRASARKREGDNYREQNHTDIENLSLRLDYEHAAGLLFLEQELVREHQELPGSLFQDEMEADRRQSAPAYAGDFSDTDTWVSRLGLRQRLTDAWSLEGELTYRDNDRRFQTSFRTFPGTPATQTRRVTTFNPRLIGQVPFADATLRLALGADLENVDYALRTAFGPQEVDQQTRALYGQATLPIGDAWSATLGLRHARVDNAILYWAGDTDLDDAVTVGSLGLVFRPNDRWRLFARADQNYRFAKVDEHTNPVFGQPVGLKNQTGVSYELGVERVRGPLTGKALAYRLDLDDEISFDSTGYSNVNLEATRRHGAILELAYAPERQWLLGATYTYTDSEVTAGPFDGNRLPLVPRHGGRLFADWSAPSGLGLLAEAVLTGEQVMGADFANRYQRLDDYATLNLAVRYLVEGWRLSARINNLLDERYSESGNLGMDGSFATRETWFPAPDRNFWLTASYELGR